MKKPILYSVVVVSILMVSIVAILLTMQSIGRETTDNVNLTAIPTVTYVDYLIPVSSYSDTRKGLTLAELKQESLCALTDNQELVQAILPGVPVNYVTADNVSAALEKGQICLLPPSLVDYRYKTLSLDDSYFWAKETDLSTYPLQFASKKEFTVESQAELRASALLTNSDNRSRIFASGEIIPARAVDRLALNKNNNYTYMYDYFRQDIESADLAIGLLENPLNGNPSPCTGCMSFVGDVQNALGLKTVGFDIMSLAGNHAGDGGQTGYATTIKAFADVGVLTTGTGNSDAAKLAPAITTVNGYKIGVIAADTVAGYYWNKNSSAYGTNWFSNSSNSNINWDRVKSVSAIKKEYGLDYLIAYLSWGVEYTNKATNFQEELAHGLIDNGVDLIIASHPHWVQNIEFYKGKAIFFSLGNFLFDQNHTDPTREAVALNLYFTGLDLRGIEVMPFISCGPFITNNDLTNKYLAGQIDQNYLDTHNEKNGCVYFQPKKLATTNSHFQTIWQRMLKYSNIIK